MQTKEFPELSRLDPARGCLSPAGGRGPYFALGKAQREDIRAALATPAYRPAGEEKIRLELARFNCIGCHERGALGGVTRERNDYFTSADPKLGEPGRLPPPLTGTGAKLQLDWLRNTIANGQRSRPYVKVRMPAFGAENVSGLAELFAAADEVPAFVPGPERHDIAARMRRHGCTEYHDFPEFNPVYSFSRFSLNHLRNPPGTLHARDMHATCT